MRLSENRSGPCSVTLQVLELATTDTVWYNLAHAVLQFQMMKSIQKVKIQINIYCKSVANLYFVANQLYIFLV